MLKPTPLKSKTDDAAAGSDSRSEVTLRSLFEAEESNLLRFAFSLTGRRAVAEEIVQDAFLKLHARWKDVDSPRAWLVQAVRNQAITYLRKIKRESLRDERDGDVLEVIDWESIPERWIEQMEMTAALRQIVAELPDQDQELIRLKYFEGRKYREIAELTGLSIGNVGYRLHHLMQRLADDLRPFGIDNPS